VGLGAQAEGKAVVAAVGHPQVAAGSVVPQAQKFASSRVTVESRLDRVVPMDEGVEEAGVAVEGLTGAPAVEVVVANERLSSSSAASEKKRSFPVSDHRRLRSNSRSHPKSSRPCLRSKSILC